MRIKSLLLTFVLCGAVVSATGANKAAADTTEMGVHPYKETHNMAWETTGYSLTFHGGVNIFDADYPTAKGRFSNFGYPSVGINFEYNFSPIWGIGVGYSFSMPRATLTADSLSGRQVVGESYPNSPSYTVKKGEVMHSGMMHKGQVYITFDLINAWFPRAWKDIFALSVFGGFGGAFYHNDISFNDFESTDYLTGKHSDSGKYVKDDDNASAHKTQVFDKDGKPVLDEKGNPVLKNKYETVGFIPLGASAEFNVSRQISLGARVQYNLFLNDYVDNRYEDKANKSNDGLLDIELLLRWKINAKKKNHVMNISSTDVMEEKYYQSHPRRRRRPHVVDTLVVYHRDTIVVINRDTIVTVGAPQRELPETTPIVVPVQPQGRCDLTLYPGWEAEADAVVVEGQSLSQLARKYYNNTFCWVYLWIANRSIAPDPNLIMPKCVLKVPRLNACQKSITKQEAKDMCAELRAKE